MPHIRPGSKKSPLFQKLEEDIQLLIYLQHLRFLQHPVNFSCRCKGSTANLYCPLENVNLHFKEFLPICFFLFEVFLYNTAMFLQKSQFKIVSKWSILKTNVPIVCTNMSTFSFYKKKSRIYGSNLWILLWMKNKRNDVIVKKKKWILIS